MCKFFIIFIWAFRGLMARGRAFRFTSALVPRAFVLASIANALRCRPRNAAADTTQCKRTAQYVQLKGRARARE